MFSGIIEGLSTVLSVVCEGENVRFSLRSPFKEPLHIDESVAHDGVCLTVVSVRGDKYDVVAMSETLHRSVLGCWKVGSEVNVERAMRLNDRLDGHIVQGHVDTTGKCVEVIDHNGSKEYVFEYKGGSGLVVEKGSISVNGVSLTVCLCESDKFSVNLIPYTLDHTNLGRLEVGGVVDIEFDILGKYVLKYLKTQNKDEKD